MVFISVQRSDQLRLAYFIPAMAHDEQSLAEIAANSAVASRVWLQERLGRSDVQVSCVYPFMHLCLHVSCVISLFLLVCLFLSVPGTRDRQKSAAT